MEKLLTPGEVAKIACVTLQSVGRWTRKGLLKPAVTLPGGHRRYNEKEVRKFLGQGEVNEK